MKVAVLEFCYTNARGGTGLSKGPFDPAYPHPEATVEVVSGFWDYETGYRFIGVPGDENLVAFRAANGSTTDTRIFFSEFDLVDRHKDLRRLISTYIKDGNDAC